MAITLRTTKSRALTHEELDGNFTDLNGRTTTIEGAYVKTVNGVSPTSNAITITTDSINEGSTNVYFTNARADARIGAASITDLSNVDYTGTPTTNHVLTWDGDSWVSAAPPGLGGGESNDGTQLGTGADVFKDKVGSNLRFRSIIATAPIVATENTDDITLTFTPSADLDVNTQKIINVVDPTAAQHAATKNYADTTFLGLAGGTMTGAINMGSSNITNVADPSQAQHAATKNYVDTTAVLLTGSTMTGALTLSGAPTSNLHAATKAYVDGEISGLSSTLTIAADTGSNDTVTVGVDTLTFSGTANEIETTVSDNEITIGLPDDVTITGNLTVSGTTTTVSSTDLAVTDGKIQMGVNNESSDIIDLGFVAHYYNGVRRGHAGLFRDATDKKFKLMGDYGPEPDQTTIDTSDEFFRLATLQLESIEVGDTDNPSMAIRGSRLETINSNQDIEIETAGTGIVNIGADVQLKAQADLRFADSDSSNYVAFQSPATVASNITWTLPDADASVSGYALVSDSAGTLSWAAAGATISEDATTNTDFNIYFASTTSGALTAVKYDTALNYNPSTETLSATVFDGVSTTARYADLAENYLADQDYEPGTVVKVGGSAEITEADTSAIALAGVISTAPAYLMNSALDGGLPVALQGRVPVKVKGLVNKGEVVYASNNGLAKADSAGAMVGIALEDKNTADVGLVECLLKC